MCVGWNMWGCFHPIVDTGVRFIAISDFYTHNKNLFLVFVHVTIL
nr:MAG TPA: hypothetical protein [Caudoviricetes sp.]